MAMPTTVTTASSVAADLKSAVHEALRGAIEQRGRELPTLGFLFCTSKFDLAAVLRHARGLLPGTEFIGCTVGGSFTEHGVIHGGITAITLTGKLVHGVQMGRNVSSAPKDVATELAKDFQSLTQTAAARGLAHSTTVVIPNGLYPIRHILVDELRRQTRTFQQIVGGCAGEDEYRLQKTHVGANGTATHDGAVAVHVFSGSRWGVGVDHGLTADSPRMAAVSEGSLLLQLDGRPALDVYRQHARDNGIELDESNTMLHLMQHQLGEYFLDDICRVHIAVALGPNGSLVLGGELPNGAAVRILKSEPTRMIAAAKRAAAEAKANLGSREAAGLLCISCGCRDMSIGERYSEEIQAIREVFPDVPMAGFFSYGEIARYRGKLDGYHNSTMVVLAIARDD